MTCKIHKTYQGKRAPKVDCSDCWVQYFSTDTEKKKEKYLDEYNNYIKTTKKTSIEDTTDETSDIANNKNETELRINADGHKVTSVPIRVNTYFWSEELKATVKINGFSNGMVSLIVDNRMVVPFEQMERLKLVPYNSDYFVYTTRRIPPDAVGKTITVYTPDIISNSESQIVAAAQKNVQWPFADILWTADSKIAAETLPDPETTLKTKKVKLRKKSK